MLRAQELGHIYTQDPTLFLLAFSPPSLLFLLPAPSICYPRFYEVTHNSFKTETTLALETGSSVLTTSCFLSFE